MWELDHNEGWAPKNWCFSTVELERLLRVPWTTRKSNQSILKEINPEYSLEGLMLKLKLQYFGHLMWSWCIEKDPDIGKDWGQEVKGTTEDEMVEWHHQLNGPEFERTLGDGEGQGSLACCSPWVHKLSDHKNKWKIVTVPNTGKNVKTLGLSCTAGRNIKWYSLSRNTWAVS